MEFLVQIEVDMPATMPQAERSKLMAAEVLRGEQLLESETIVRIWRIPGRTANVGIWSAADATALHEVISSLPMFPYLRADVTPLATHHLEA